jgi:hypothetical protein
MGKMTVANDDVAHSGIITLGQKTQLMTHFLQRNFEIIF